MFSLNEKVHTMNTRNSEVLKTLKYCTSIQAKSSQLICAWIGIHNSRNSAETFAVFLVYPKSKVLYHLWLLY